MRKEWRRWGARLMAGIMIATSVWIPVYADVAVAIPVEGKYTTETEYTTEITEYKKLPVATDTEADRDDKIPDDEIPGDEIMLPTATPTEAIPVEAVLPVATPTTLMMAPMMLASSQVINLSDATIKNGNSNGRYNVLNLEAGAHVTLNLSGTIEIHGGTVLAKSARAAGIGAGGTSSKNNFTVYASSEQARVELRGTEAGEEITVPAGKSQVIDGNGAMTQVEYGEAPSNAVFHVTSERGDNDGIEVRPNGSVSLSGTGPYTISMMNPNKEVVGRVIQIKSACIVTLDGIRIDASSSNKVPPLEIASGLSDVTLILKGQNYLKDSQTTAAIDNHGTPLTIEGDGSLTATEGICISGGEVTGTIEYQGDPQYNFLAKISEDPIKIQASNGQGATVYAGASSPGEVVFGTTTEGMHTFQDSDWYMHVVYGDPHSLTVTDGEITDPKTAGYAQGEKVAITAESAKNGQYFYKWEVISGSGTFEDPDSAGTTFTMGDADTVITACYKGESTVTVINGTKSPDKETYAPGAQVTITAAAAENGKYFDSWKITSGAGSTLADAKKSTTTLTVGKQDTVVEAIYKNGPVLTVNRGSGSGTYAPGAKINIQAQKGDRDELFLGWILESGSGTFAQPSWESTTFTIGSEDTVITAQFYRDTGDFVITGGQYGVDYSFEEKNEWGRLRITGSGTYEISLKEGIRDTNQQILIEKGTPTIILHDVRMVSYGTMEICGTKAKLVLDGENSFGSTGYTTSYKKTNGITVSENGSLEITSICGDGSTEGSLYAKGHRNPYDDWDRSHAGIGGLAEQITIKGGTIYAEGSDGGPGIGNNGALGSSSSDPVHISITGGQVTAVGNNAPGIGNGEKNLGAAAVAIADGLKIQDW